MAELDRGPDEPADSEALGTGDEAKMGKTWGKTW